MSENQSEIIFKRVLERGGSTSGAPKRVVSDEDTQSSVFLVKSSAIELCSLYNELESSKGIIAKRLAEVLLPEYWKGIEPGVIVVHARSRETKALTIEDEFSYGGATCLSLWNGVDLLDGDVSHLVFSSQSLQSKNLDWSDDPNVHSQLRLAPREVAIGVELPQKSEKVDGLVFFFECLHNQSELLFRALPFCRWHHEGKLLKARCQTIGSLKESIFTRWGESSSTANSTIDCIDSRFVEIEGALDTDFIDSPTKSQTVTLPTSQVSGRRIQWFTVQFPADVPIEVLQSMRCYINCFPASNLKFHTPVFELRTGNETFELSDHENTESRRFLGIECVFTNPGERPTVLPPTAYVVRSEGVTQFDALDAKQKIQDTLRSIEQEFRAYDLLGEKHEMTTLLEQARAMRDKLSTDGTHLDKVFIQFLGARPGRVEVRYFSTVGLPEIQIKKGQRFESRDSAIAKDTLAAMTDYIREKPTDDDARIERLRHLVLSRGRIVTQVDIVSACNAFFSKEIDGTKTTLKKAGRMSIASTEGIIEVLSLSIFPRPESHLSREEWLVGSRQLEKYLQRRSSSLLPIEVVVAQ